MNSFLTAKSHAAQNPAVVKHKEVVYYITNPSGRQKLFLLYL